MERNKPILISPHPQLQYYSCQKTFAMRFESRLDVLLLRTSFANSIYRARHMIFHGKCKVDGINRISYPGVQIKHYQEFTPCKQDVSFVTKTIHQNIKKFKSFILPPTYLYVCYT